jgi:LacI family transcriptional regulator
MNERDEAVNRNLGRHLPVTIRDVAKLAGTSVAAVSATLNGSKSSTIRVGAATRERIIAAAAQIGYTSNPIAKSLATGRTKVLGLMLPYANAFVDDNPFCRQVIDGIMTEAVNQHYNLMMYTATSGMGTSAHAAHLVDSRIEGLIMVMPAADSEVFQKCEKRHIPYVSVLRDPVPGQFSVNADEFTGGYIAGQHLISLGHTRIAHLAGSADVTTSGPRRAGFEAALRDGGVEPDPRLIITSAFDWKIGYARMKQLLEYPAPIRPTAVFAANDLCAEGAMRAIRELNLRIPQDLAVVGYDDTNFATMTQPPLTSVHLPIAEMGTTAARMLIDRLEGKELDDPNPILPVSLTIRNSCGALATPTMPQLKTETLQSSRSIQ